MRRISQAEMRRTIDLSLRMLPERIKRDLAAKPAMTRDAATDAVACHLLERLVPDGWIVIAPTMLDKGQNHYQSGEFGVTEPHPFPDMAADIDTPDQLLLSLSRDRS